MSRPLIGISTYVEESRFVVHDTMAAVLPWSYVDKVRQAGGRPLLIPPQPDGGVEVLDALDGLIVAGGADVEPARYGEEPHDSVFCNPQRDEAELPLVRTALHAGLPILGICRGLQVMAVVSGGRLHQHLPDVLGHGGHSMPGPVKSYAQHPVRFAPGSRCGELFGPEAVVNSYHHQGVADPGRFVPTGWCTADGLIESMEHPDHPFAVGVQWHPEDMPGLELFAALVAAAGQVPSTRRANALTEDFATLEGVFAAQAT